MSNFREVDPNSIEAVFGRMLEKSTVISGLISLALVCGILWCVVQGMDIPDLLAMSLSTIVGYFFGSKGTDAVVRGVEAQHHVS